MKRNRTTTPKDTQNSEPNMNLFIPNSLLVTEIFTRLPVKSLLRFKTLSKQFNSVISSTHFADLHFKHQSSSYLLIDSKGSLYTLNWDSYSSHQEGLVPFKGPNFTHFIPALTKFLGSSNGLLCSLHNLEYYFLWNPSTNKYRIIFHPCIKSSDFRTCEVFLGGFGYVSSIDDYKLVEIMVFKSPRPIQVGIFTLKDGCWKHLNIIDENFVLLVDNNVCMEYGVRPGIALVNDALHWLVSFNCLNVVKGLYLVAFDLLTEEIHKIPPPASLGFEYCFEEAFVLVIDGCLCLCNPYKNHGLVEMWGLEEYGVWGSWRKLFKVHLEMGLVGSKLPHWNLFVECPQILVRPSNGKPHMFVDLSSNPPKKVSLPQELYLAFAVSYVESFVSPFPAVEDHASSLLF